MYFSAKFKNLNMKLNLIINEQTLNEDFKRIAFELMNNWILEINSNQYRITEIEFYFKSEYHNDPYCHGNELQKEKEKWYFHGSGIDLTFGDKDFYASILIRAIYDIKNDNYIYGPLNCITEFFKSINNVFDTDLIFGLVPSKEQQFKIEVPIAAPRVGLNMKIDSEKYEALYRFLIMPKQKHAEKTRIAEGMRKLNISEEEIKKIWG